MSKPGMPLTTLVDKGVPEKELTWQAHWNNQSRIILRLLSAKTAETVTPKTLAKPRRRI